MQAKSLMLALMMIAMPLSGCIAGDDGEKDEEIADLETIRDGLQLERDTLQSELSAIEAELVALQASSSSDADEISGLLSQIDSLNEQITALDASIASLQMNVMQDSQSTLDPDCLFGQSMTISSIGFDNDESGSLEGDEIMSMSQMCTGATALIPANPDTGDYYYDYDPVFVVNGSNILWIENTDEAGGFPGDSIFSVILSDLTPNGTKSIFMDLSHCYHLDCDFRFHSVTEIQGGLIIKLGESYEQNRLISFDYTSQQYQNLAYGLGPDTMNSNGCLVNYGDGIVFEGEDDDHGEELWFANLTHAHMNKDIRSGTMNSNVRNCFNFGEMVVFFADDGANGSELWVTDGTEDGTTMLLDANPNGDGVPWNPSPMAPDEEFYFAGSDGEFGLELWASDGTASGTRMVKDLNPGTGSSTQTYALGAIGDDFYFASSADANGNGGLYSTDGTPSGTELVCNMSSMSSSFDSAMFHNGAIYFSGIDAGHNHSADVWRYIPGGICEKFDTREGSNGAYPTDWFMVGDSILFRGSSDEGYGVQLLAEDENGNLSATPLMGPFGEPVKYLHGLSNGLVIYAEENPWVELTQDYSWYWAEYEYFGL